MRGGKKKAVHILWMDARKRSRRGANSQNLGLSEQAIKELKKSTNTDLVLMIRRDEKFDLA